MAIAFLGIFLNSAWGFTLNGSNFLVGWQTKTLTFNVNYSGCTVSNATLDSAIDYAVALWNSVPTSGLRLVRGSSSTSSANATVVSRTATDSPLIICDANLAATLLARSGTATNTNNIPGVGLGEVVAGSGVTIDYGWLLLNCEAAKAANIANLSATDLQITLAHEIGHVLGLGHSGSAPALMYYSIANKTRASLSQDDQDAISYLYASSLFGGCGALDRLDKRGKSHGGPSGPANFAFMLGVCLFGVLFARRRARCRSLLTQLG